MRAVRITPPADGDITDILAWSEERFGPSVQARYAQLIDTAIHDIATAPERLGSRARPELGQSIRTYHLAFSRQPTAGTGAGWHRPHATAFPPLSPARRYSS